MRDLMIKLLAALEPESSSNRQVEETRTVESTEVKNISRRKVK